MSPHAKASSGDPRPGFRGFVFGHGGGAMLAGTLEILVFHPFDTASKRLMSHQRRVVEGGATQTFNNFNRVVFGGANASNGMRGRLAHMYPGSSYAVYYKVLQRTIKFAGQPYMKKFLASQNADDGFRSVLGPRVGKLAFEAVAGCLVGVCEITILPFDRMKVLAQTNQTALKQRSLMRVLRDEGPRTLYVGAATTAARNALGTFLLFGGSSFTKEYVFGLEDYSSANFYQTTIASTVGACTGVFATSPLDVIKTRLQNKAFGQSTGYSGWAMFAKTVKEEGVSAFFKGVTPKVITTAPKLIFSYTMAQHFTKVLHRYDQGGDKKTNSSEK